MMRNLVIKAKADWHQRFGDMFDSDYQKTKILCSPDGDSFFRIVYSENLAHWYSSPSGKARYDAPKCFICAKHDEFTKLERAMQFKHIDVFFNLKSVARHHFLMAPSEHREHPTTEDVLALQELAQISGWSIIGNLNNSGASYPRHVHYQSLDTEFPIITRPAQSIIADNLVNILKVDYPIAAFCFTPAGKNGLEIICRLIPLLPQPFNLMFCGQDIYLVPRTKSVPSNTGGFKFATAEVCGTIFVRSKQQFDMFDYQTVITALKDVCLNIDGNKAKGFGQDIMNAYLEVLP